MLRDERNGHVSSDVRGRRVAGRRLCSSNRERMRRSRQPSVSVADVETLEDRTLLSAQLLQDIHVEGSSNPDQMSVVNGTLFFAADDGLHGVELWKSDGTTAGTSLIKDIAGGSQGSFPTDFTALNNKLFFRAAGGLWSSDGTSAGTVLVKGLDPQTFSDITELTAVGNRLFFQASSSEFGSELWTSDGTSAGTRQVRDIVPGEFSAAPSSMTSVNGSLYFFADVPETGRELWKSDGTTQGTERVAVVAAGLSGVPPRALGSVGETLIFASFSMQGGWRLWSTAGTAASTKVISTGVQDISLADANVVGEQLLFSAFTSSTGWEMWHSDGTANGTGIVRDLNPGPASANPTEFLVIGGLMYFSANDGLTGAELWATDGTAANTQLFKDIQAGVAGSGPSRLANINGKLYFTADDGLRGRELWKSDLTVSGTAAVTDIQVGLADSEIGRPVHLNGALVFSANDGSTGQELWAISQSAPVAPAIVFPRDITEVNYPTFRWSAIPGADHYDLWVNDLTTGESGIIRNRQVATNSFPTPVPLALGHTFIWTVRGINEFGLAGAWARHVVFSVDSRLSAPVMQGPSGSMHTTTLPTFTWQSVFGADHYDLWVNNLTTGESGVIREKFILGTTYQSMFSLPNENSYIWTVRAVDRFGTPGRWADHRIFTLEAGPSAPVLLGPVGTVTATRQPTFSWASVSNADHYDLWVDDLTANQVSVIRRSELTSSVYTSAMPFENGHTYVWTVRAISADGIVGKWSAHQTFEVDYLAPPVLLGPSSTIAGNPRPTFSWTGTPAAHHYDLWVNDLTTGQVGVIRNRNVQGTNYIDTTALQPGHSYIWTVRAIGVNGEAGEWADHRTFRLDANSSRTASLSGSQSTKAEEDAETAEMQNLAFEDTTRRDDVHAIVTVLSAWPTLDWWRVDLVPEDTAEQPG